jgi:hypothetical protein
MLQGLNVPKASEAKVACNQIRFLIVVSSAHGLKNIKRVCIKCKPGFKNPKALSTEVMPSNNLCPDFWSSICTTYGSTDV